MSRGICAFNIVLYMNVYGFHRSFEFLYSLNGEMTYGQIT